MTTSWPTCMTRSAAKASVVRRRLTRPAPVIALLAALLLLPIPAVATNASPSAGEREALGQYLKAAINKADSFQDRFDAEVWLLDMSGRLKPFIADPQQRLDLLRSIHREASAAGLAPELVLSVIQVESRFDRFAISRVGAQGLMQVMPFWRKEIGRPDDNLTEVDTNLRYGCQILKYYLEREKGRLRPALARYNGSLGKNWYPKLVLNAWRKNWYNGELAGLR